MKGPESNEPETAEILGRATGLNGGRSGTIRLSAPELGFLSTSGIVGAAPRSASDPL
jgi:TPP-dependent pyruvate/acetoin dehydrogenase alpha subunit